MAHDGVTVERDALVGRTVHLEHRDRAPRGTPGGVVPHRAGQGDDRGDLVGVVAGEPVGHERAVGVPDQVHPLGVDLEPLWTVVIMS